MSKPIQLIIADDHKLFSGSLKNMFDTVEGINVVALAGNGKELISLLEQHPCDIVLLDINMPEMDGIDASNVIYHRFPKVQLIVLSMYNRPEFIKKLTGKAVRGYVLKNADPEELVKAIQTVHEGGKYFSPDLALNPEDVKADGLLFDDRFNHKLSKREIEILKQISKGKSNTEIAELLFLSPHTVDTHRKNMMSKLEVHSVAELVKYAVQIGLTDE